MANNCLTEKEWRSVSKGTTWKVDALAKALAAFEKSESGEPGQALKALDEVGRQAEVLGKSAKGDKALQQWLADLDKAAQARRKELDKATAEAQKGEEEEEDAGLAQLLDPKRLLSVFQALKRDPQRRSHFAFVVGKTDAAFTLRPKLAGRKLFSKLSAGLESKVGTYGQAWIDGTTLILQIEKPMSGVVKKVRAPIKACGFRVTRVLLWDADGAVLEEDASDDEALLPPPAAPAPAAGTPEPPPAAPNPQRLAFEGRLRELGGPLQRALAEGHPQAAKLREVLSFARTKAEAGQFGAALNGLEALAKLIEPADPPPAPTAAPPVAGSEVPPKADYVRCAKVWTVTRSRVGEDIKRLRETILAEFQGSPLIDEISSRIGRLDELAQRFDEQLDAVLEQASAANQEEDRVRLHRQASASIRRMLAQLDADPLLARLKDNPFVAIDPRAALGTALQVLAKQIA